MLQRLKKWKQSGGLLVLLLICLVTPAEAILKDLGPIDPVHGYPVWYRDFSTGISANGQDFPQGLPLALCDSATQNANGYLCGLLPEAADLGNGVPGYDPALPRDFATNFPGESFYFTADSVLAAGGDIGDAVLVIGLEAAFAGLAVQQGDQITFARVRIRVDINTPGNYRITHPYGVHVFPNVAAGIKTINFTEDIGIGGLGNFNGALTGAIGPFVTWDTEFPIVVGDEVFIGDPNVPHTITGSPFGTNFFRIERIDAQGNQLSVRESSDFTVTGKIFTTPIASPLTATRASYARNASGAHIFVFADADVVSNAPPSLSSLQVSAAGIAPTLMSTDGNGHFFAHLSTTFDTLPATVTITNIADVPANLIEVPVTDEVYISSAIYNSDTQVMTLSASSSDTFAPPILTTNYGDLIGGQQFVTDVMAPLPSITVVSSANGQDTEQIQVTSAAIANGQIASPNGGEVLVSGSQVTITWADFSPDAVRYRLFYLDQNNTPHLIANVGNVNSYVWTVPSVTVEEPGLLIRMSAFDMADNKVGLDFSDAPFSIVPDPDQLRVVVPNGGEALISGSVFNIQWNSAVGATRYRLFYLDADGTAHLIAIVGNVSSYDWTVPAVIAEETGKLIRVTAFDAAGQKIGFDLSDAPFVIQPAPIP